MLEGTTIPIKDGYMGGNIPNFKKGPVRTGVLFCFVFLLSFFFGGGGGGYYCICT